MARREDGERARLELLAGLDEAEADLEALHYTDYTDATLPQLADELNESRANSANSPDGELPAEEARATRCAQDLAAYCGG